MEAIATHDYRPPAHQPDHLSFQKGDTLKVTNAYNDGNWYLAQRGLLKGIVPSTYIQLRSHEWYRGGVSRATAETLLSPSPKGAFLVRDSECAPGEFSISVRTDTSVQHFKVYEDSVGKYYIWTVRFETLNELVDYYRSTSISRAESSLLLRDIPRPLQVLALYDFAARESDELQFRKGDVITVLEQDSGGWWLGELPSRLRGRFPVTYVALSPSP